MSSPSLPMRLLRGGWRFLDGLRRILHLILLLVVLVLLSAIFAREQVYVPDSAALVIAPRGVIVDQLSGDALDRALSELRGSAQPESLLRDLIEAIRRGSEDRRIRALYLQLDGLEGAGLSKLQELAAALEEFRSTGKPIIAAGSAFGRDQYYLAAQADELFMHPMGSVVIEGYGRFIPYFKSALDALYIDYVSWTAGEYKSFTEPYTRDEMSDEDREASSLYLDVMWNAYTADVTSARDLDPAALDDLADNFVDSLSSAGGDPARMALDAGLVDELLTREEVDARLAELAGPSATDAHSYSGIGYREYLRAAGEDGPVVDESRTVAVLTLAGEILDGVQAPGSIGGDSAVRVLRRLRDDDNVRALVLRVDSPGGSAFASELILEELRAFQESGRPLVVSMGSVAASGGYWISMNADEIFASPTTITGSIGVGALAPMFPRALERLGIHIDGVGTNALSGQFSQLRGLGESADAFFSQSVRHLYTEFVGKVADSRDMSYEAIDTVAQGRVWAGVHALEYGLVDALGGLDAAVEAAAALAGLDEGDYRVEHVEQELSLSEAVALQFAMAAAPAFEMFDFDGLVSGRVGTLVRTLLDPLDYVGLYNDPLGLYSYCFCDVR